jgi:hypothetical protein
LVHDLGFRVEIAPPFSATKEETQEKETLGSRMSRIAQGAKRITRIKSKKKRKTFFGTRITQRSVAATKLKATTTEN